MTACTDDERRRVVERLREFSKDRWSLTVGGNSATIRYAVSDIVFGDKKYHSGVDLLDRLADLIEPTCDRDTLLALADELSGDTLAVPAVYGTYLGGYVAACQDVARRIREACGMDDAG